MSAAVRRRQEVLWSAGSDSRSGSIASSLVSNDVATGFIVLNAALVTFGL